jgi:hypothetical protein
MTKSTFYVYGYFDPITGEMFYVGKGSDYRDHSHMKPSSWNAPEKTTNPFFYHKIKSLMERDEPPFVKRLYENLTEDEAYDIESDLIAENGRRFVDGGKLFNISSNRGGSRKGSKKPWTEDRKIAHKKRHAEKRKANNKEELLDMFLNKCMTRREIAEHYGVSEVLIKKRLQDFGIKKNSEQMKKTMDMAFSGHRKTLKCQNCGENFEVVSSHNRKFCSKTCVSESRLEEVVFKGVTYKNKYVAAEKTGLSSVYIGNYKENRNAKK